MTVTASEGAGAVDEVTEAVQPDEVEGQGGEGHEAPYADYLNRIPEDVRDEVEPIFKEWDANTTRRFQEHSEYRKQWEPLEQTGISQLSPEEAQWLVQFRQALDDPQSVKQWYDSYAREYGLQEQQAAQPQAETAPTVDEFLAPDTQQLQALLKQELSPIQEQMQHMAEWRDQQEYAGRVAEAEQFVQGQLKELESQHPQEFNREAIEKLVPNYINSNPREAVNLAFADWQKIRAQIERDYAQGKADQPPPAESGGVAAATPDMPKTLAEANAQALEQIRNMHRS